MHADNVGGSRMLSVAMSRSTAQRTEAEADDSPPRKQRQQQEQETPRELPSQTQTPQSDRGSVLARIGSATSGDEGSAPRRSVLDRLSLNKYPVTPLAPPVPKRPSPRALQQQQQEKLQQQEEEQQEEGQQEEGQEVDEHVSVESRLGVKKTMVKCTFWPNCKQGDQCKFLHPGQVSMAIAKEIAPTVVPKPKLVFMPPPVAPAPCRYGSSCTNPMCTFQHPIPCRFGDLCGKPGCPYVHPPPAKPCRYGDACLNKLTTCRFTHPALPSAGPAPSGETACRYGSGCHFKNRGCPYAHPHISERAFALPAAEETVAPNDPAMQ